MNGDDDNMKIPKAKEAVDKEWLSLESTAFDMKSVRPKRDVKREAIAKGEHVHFGSLMPLCHIKHSELNETGMDENKKVYKGRVVFRGDQVKDIQQLFNLNEMVFNKNKK